MYPTEAAMRHQPTQIAVSAFVMPLSKMNHHL